MKNKTEIRKLIFYFISTYIFSWAFWIPSALLFKNADSFIDLVTSPIFIMLQTLGAAGPSIVALIFLKVEKKGSEMNSIFNRYTQWHFKTYWYLFSTLLFPIISFLALILHSLIITPIANDHPIIALYTDMGLAAILILPAMFLGQIFTSPLLEEFGWRGYAQPVLQKHFSILTSSAIIGFVWGFWHLPLTLVYGFNVPVQMIMFVLVSIWIGYLYNSTNGSMLAVLLFHASINIGLNVLAPKHDSLILVLLVFSITIFIIYLAQRKEIKAFNFFINNLND